MKNIFLIVYLVFSILFLACARDFNEDKVIEIDDVRESDSIKGNNDSTESSIESGTDFIYDDTAVVVKEFSPYIIDSSLVNEYLDTAYWLSYDRDSNTSIVEEWIADGSGMSQGFDVFGDYLIGLNPGMSTLKSSDMYNRCSLQSTLSGMEHIVAQHANCQNFTTCFFSAEDKLPLLLVSGSILNNGIDLKGVAYLMMIEWRDGLFYASLVQRLTTVAGIYTDSIGSNYRFEKYSNIMVDRETGHIFVIAGSSIFEMELPPLFDADGNVLNEAELTVDMIIRRIGFAYKTKFPQGACIHNGIAYIASGTNPTKGYLQVVDIKSGKELQCIYLPDIGYDYEPEDIAFWRGSMIISGGGSHGIYKLNWK